MMCGIIAVFSKKSKLDIDICDNALNKLSLRGPDFSFWDTYLDGQLYIGQTVLSITGKPYNAVNKYHKSLTGRFNIVFNGEVYNHRALFKKFLKAEAYPCFSRTDTEVLVNIHEVQSPMEVYNNLRGMFTYIIYDNKKSTLIIGRDIIGEKVLYKYEDESILILSSEIGPILDILPSIKLNTNILREYFFTRHLLSPRETVFNGISLIQPGNLLEYDLVEHSFTTLKIIKPADLIDPEVVRKNKQRSLDDLREELESIFRSNAISLAPEGIEYTSVLSGGIDSSVSSYYMNMVKPPSHLFALEFPGKDKISENLMPFNKHFHRSITKVKVDAKLFSSFFDQAYRAICSPFPTHSFISQAIVSKNIRNRGSKVWIGGHGGDELFGGYEFYKQLVSYKGFPQSNPSIYSGYVPLGIEFEGWNDKWLKEKISTRWKECSQYYAFEEDLRERMVQTVLYSDTVIMLESVGIREADTMSMLYSIEPRCFYLTWDILKFALNLPAFYKINLDASDSDMITRPLMKKLFISLFGKELLYPKQGFSGFPNEAGRLLVGGEYKLVKNVLGQKYIPKVSGAKKQAIEWKMINTELFLRYCFKSGYI